jgi:toxin ParE1/3/4
MPPIQARIEIRPLALRDIRETTVWLDENAGATIALRYFDAVQATLEMLAGNVMIGSPCGYSRQSLAALRRWPVKGFERWLVFYLPAKQGIDVARVLHGARNLDEIFD